MKGHQLNFEEDCLGVLGHCPHHTNEMGEPFGSKGGCSRYLQSPKQSPCLFKGLPSVVLGKLGAFGPVMGLYGDLERQVLLFISGPSCFSSDGAVFCFLGGEMLTFPTVGERGLRCLVMLGGSVCTGVRLICCAWVGGEGLVWPSTGRLVNIPIVCSLRVCCCLFSLVNLKLVSWWFPWAKVRICLEKAPIMSSHLIWSRFADKLLV